MSDSADGLADILRGAGIIFLGTVLANGMGLLGEVLIARTLLPEQFGEIALAYTIVSTLTVILTLGMQKGVPRLISGDEPRDRQQRLLLSAFMITIPVSILGFVLLAVFSPIIGEFFSSPKIVNILPVFGLYLIVFSAAQITSGGLRGLEQAWKTTIARNGGRIVGLVGFGFAVLIGAEYIGAAGYYVFTQLAIALIAVYFIYNQLFVDAKSEWIPKTGDVAEIFSFSWPLAISGGFLTLMGNLDILMIGYFLESSATGYYRSIQPLSLLLLITLSSFVFLFMPIVTKYYKRGEEEIVKELFKSTAKFVSIVSFPIALVFVLFSEDVVVAFYGATYAPASFAFSVLVVGTYLRVFVGPNAAMIKAIGRTRIDMISAVAGMIVNVILNVMLIPIYGITGAALATGMGYFTYNVFEIGVIYYSIGSHPFSINTIKPLLPTTLFAIVIEALTADRSLGLITLLAIGAIIAVVQFLSVIGTRSLDATDVFLIQRIESRLGIKFPYIRWGIKEPITQEDNNILED